jgi:hypothetical protein
MGFWGQHDGKTNGFAVQSAVHSGGECDIIIFI